MGIRRLDKIPNARIREFCRMMKAVDEKNGEGVLRWFGYVGRMENNRISKRVHVGERVRQTRRMVHDRSEWRGFVRKNTWALPWD